MLSVRGRWWKGRNEFFSFLGGEEGVVLALISSIFCSYEKGTGLRRDCQAKTAFMTQNQANLEDFEVSQLRDFRQDSGKCQTSKRQRLCILTSKQQEKALLLLLLSSCFCAQSGLIKPPPPPPFIWPRGEPSRKSGRSSKLSLELAGGNKLGVEGGRK